LVIALTLVPEGTYVIVNRDIMGVTALMYALIVMKRAMEVFVMMVLLVMVCVLATLALLGQTVCKMIVYRDFMGVTALMYALTAIK
jgi:hypothetical protein